MAGATLPSRRTGKGFGQRQGDHAKAQLALAAGTPMRACNTSLRWHMHPGTPRSTAPQRWAAPASRP